MTVEVSKQSLPKAGERVLLLNPPVYDTRFHWSQWAQPITLLQLATYARATGAEPKMVDALEHSRGTPIHKERVSVLRLDDDVVNKWRFGQTKAALNRRLRDLKKELWVPERIYIDCLTTFWWEGASEFAHLARDLFPEAEILLTGGYGALAEDHVWQHLPVNAVAPMVSSDVSVLPSDITVLSQTPHFAYISLGAGRRAAEEVANEVIEKLKLYKIQHFAFVEHGIAFQFTELFTAVLENLVRHEMKAVFYVLGNIAPKELVQHPHLPALMKRVGFRQIVFADDRQTPISADSDQQLIEDYRRTVELCGQAGFPQRTDALVGSICVGREGENLEERAQLATLIAHHVGSIVLWAYQPRLEECQEIALEDQNGKLFPLRRQNNLRYRDYVDLLGLAAILNAKYRERTFDFLGDGLIPRLLRESFDRRGWDPDPVVKGDLVLPARPRNKS